MTGSLNVIVIGGGIGGLRLAQGLRKAGVAVEVYERDRALGSRWEGYRIHVNPAGSRSLRACLPARPAVGGVCGHVRARGRLRVPDRAARRTRRGRGNNHVSRGADDPAEDHFAVDRPTLRRLLLAGLDDIVQFDAEFVRTQRAAGQCPAPHALG